MLLELQIRTKLQHSWATAVETFGLYTGTSLKSNQGKESHLDFFRIVSALYAIKERQPVAENLKDLEMKELMVRCYNLDNSLKITHKLRALSVTLSDVERNKFNAKYYILYIKLKERRLSITPFSSHDEASLSYSTLEKDIEEGKTAVVLVSVDDLKELRKSYPSFFLDTNEFINTIDKIKTNCKNWKYI